MSDWQIGNIAVSVIHGGHDDSKLDLVIKTKGLSIGVDVDESITDEVHPNSFGLAFRNTSAAANVVYWPTISMTDSTRRKVIFNTVNEALETANTLDAKSIGFYTMGLEISRIPSWEVAEEIVKAVVKHSKSSNSVQTIYLVASSPIQVSSFQYALNKIGLVTS